MRQLQREQWQTRKLGRTWRHFQKEKHSFHTLGCFTFSFEYYTKTNLYFSFAMLLVVSPFVRLNIRDAMQRRWVSILQPSLMIASVFDISLNESYTRMRYQPYDWNLNYIISIILTALFSLFDSFVCLTEVMVKVIALWKRLFLNLFLQEVTSVIKDGLDFFSIIATLSFV